MNIYFSKTENKVKFEDESDCNHSLETYNWTATVKIKTRKMILLGNQSLDKFIVKQQIGKKTLSLCKSNLQKCIRRKETDKTIRTALAIYSFSPTDLFRRLTIIMIEDCLPYPTKFNLLVWYMAATSKGYVLSNEEMSDVFGIITTMCESGKYEIFNGDMEAKNKISYLFEDDVLYDKLNVEQQAFILSMEIRILYGGMLADKQMLQYHQELWIERFLDNEKWWSMLEDQDDYEIELDTVSILTKDDILIESLDFHCYPFILRKLQERFTELTEDRIRLAIWKCRSRINYREYINGEYYKKITEENNKDYEMIKKDLEGFVNWLLEKIDLRE